jgi:DMSO/TMAO reductase YedYZ heme-binding membrane subunit
MTSGHAMWYLTRGSGVVTLLLLTASLVLGIAGTVRLKSRLMPRFGVADLHRNLTLLAVAFLGIHVATTIADAYTPIGLKDAFVPFVSSYRPIWLGLGALACDLLLALVITSVLRVRLGLTMWRRVHWLAYACWPLALVHALGTGSDPRVGWLQVLAAASVVAVLLATALRLARSDAETRLRFAFGALAGGVALAGWAWYRTGPGAPGWAAKAGTPTSLLHSRATAATARVVATTLPKTFSARLAGTVSQTADANGLVDVHLDGTLRGRLAGRLRLVLQGIPLEEGGVNMTGSGVSFAAAGTQVYRGSIVGLNGNQVVARVADPSGQTLQLALVVSVNPSSGVLTGTVNGSIQ